MDIKNLETFVTVSELKSFTAAARKLRYTQPTVSFQIKQLEDELKMPLFERINHTVTLTGDGEKLLPIAQGILKMSSEALHISGGEAPAGLVRIAIAESLSSWQLKRCFADFRKQFPRIRLKIVCASTDAMFSMLARNEVDLVYTLDRHIFDTNYVVAFEAPVNVRFVAGRRHPLAEKDGVSITDIVRYPLILTEKDMSYRAVLDEVLAQRGIDSMPVLEVGDTHLICEILDKDECISYLPEFVAEEHLQNGKLAAINAVDMEADIWRQLIHHKNKYLSAELSCVIEYFSKY